MHEIPEVTPELRREIREARARERRERRAGRRAASARYDARSGRVMIGLTNGDAYEFSARVIPSLASATLDQLRQVEVSPSGYGLHWECIDADLSVPGLLQSSLGRRQSVTELARAARQVRSAAKATAARRNGAKGGRAKSSPRGRSGKRA